MPAKRKQVLWESIPQKLRDETEQKYDRGEIDYLQAIKRLGVSKTCFFNHRSGKVFQKQGRPKLSVPQKPRPTGALPTGTSQNGNPRSQLSSIFDTDLFLNQKLERNVLLVEQSNDDYLEYYFSKKINGHSLFGCTGCRNRKGTGGAWIQVSRQGGFLSSRFPVHRCVPAPLPLKQVIVREVERKTRQRAKKKSQLALESWKQGVKECYKIAADNGWSLYGPDSLPTLFPCWSDIGHQLHRLRRGKGSCINQNPFGEIQKSSFAYTYCGNLTGSKEGWLLDKSSTKGVILFSSDRDIETMCEAEVIAADGTFKIAPDGFKQVFTVHAEYKGEWCAVASALMIDKSENAYRFVFEALQSKSRAMGLSLKPKTVLTDFEIAEMNAATKVFGNEACKGHPPGQMPFNTPIGQTPQRSQTPSTSQSAFHQNHQAQAQSQAVQIVSTGGSQVSQGVPTTAVAVQQSQHVGQQIQQQPIQQQQIQQQQQAAIAPGYPQDPGRTIVQAQEPSEPVFVPPPNSVRVNRVLHSETYLRYIESLTNNPSQQTVSKWDRNLGACSYNTAMPHNKPPPVEMLGDAAKNMNREEVVKALWNLRDYMMKDALQISRVLSPEEL